MSAHLPFVGFGAYEDLLAAIADAPFPKRVVYLFSSQCPLPGGANGVGSLLIALEASAVLSDRVLYCRMPIGRMTTVHGRPFGPEESRRFEECSGRASSGKRILEEVALERGIRVDSAVVAFPTDVVGMGPVP